MSTRSVVSRFSGPTTNVVVARTCASLLAAGAMMLPLTGFAQGTTATLGGTVTDPTGAVVPKAQIVLKNEGTGDTRTSVSNSSGVFSFSAVPSGDYDVTITATGFRTFQQTGIHLDPGDQRAVRDINLTAGGVNDSVEVTSDQHDQRRVR